MSDQQVNGRCECGQVVFSVRSPRETITICHCGQCRRTSGHLWASTVAADSDLAFSKDDGLHWYDSSASAKRGFCKCCGSSLFYRINGDEHMAIAAGCLDLPEGFTIGKHIYVASKAGYYEISDGRPQLDEL